LSPLAQLGATFFNAAGAGYAFCLLASWPFRSFTIACQYLRSFSFPLPPPMGNYWVSVSISLNSLFQALEVGVERKKGDREKNVPRPFFFGSPSTTESLEQAIY